MFIIASTMIVAKVLNKIRISNRFLPLVQVSVRNKSNKSASDGEDSMQNAPNSNPKLGQMAKKYQIFEDKDSQVILDIYEERNKYSSLLEVEAEEEETNAFEGINLERGKEGVYDIEDLVEVLQRENSEDIFVAAVPKDIKYVDFICIVTGKSHKHMQAIAQFVRKVYKQKMWKSDLVPRLEGGNSQDWMALDLGNIALHIFSRDARILYDLDSLWSVGPQFDKEYNKQDPVAEMLEKHSVYLHDLHPAR